MNESRMENDEKDEERIIFWIHNMTPSFNPFDLCDMIFREYDALMLHYGFSSSSRRWRPFRERGARRASRATRDALLRAEMTMKLFLSTGNLESARRLAYREISLSYGDIEEITLSAERNIFFFLHLKPAIRIRVRGRLYSYRIHDEEFDYEKAKMELKILSKTKGFKFIAE